MEPDPGPLPAQVRHDEQAGTAGLGVVPVRHGVLHVRDGRVELRVLELRAVDTGKGEISRHSASHGHSGLPALTVGEMTGVVATSGNSLHNSPMLTSQI